MLFSNQFLKSIYDLIKCPSEKIYVEMPHYWPFLRISPLRGGAHDRQGKNYFHHFVYHTYISSPSYYDVFCPTTTQDTSTSWL